jgi:LysM repeat protein
MTRFISATYHPNIKAAEFIADDGRHLIRTGGTLPWRICNCGDLVSPMHQGIPSPKFTKNFIGYAKGAHSERHYFIFPDYETGRAELKASLLRKYKDRTIKKTIEAYAPENDDNDTTKYLSDLTKLTGLSEETRIKDLSESQMNSLLDSIERLEGYHAEAETRKEIWVTVSHINATDGIRPLADEEIVVMRDGKETTLKSNAIGQFPPIVHGKGTTEIHHKTIDGDKKKVGELPANQGKHWNLLTKVVEYFGMTGPVKTPENPISKKQPLHYTVQSGDSLSKIANRFNTSVEQIKKDNHLNKDTILVGQVLGINSPTSATLTATPPKKAATKTQRPTANEKKTKRVSTAEGKTTAARSNSGAGEPIALIQPEEGIAPWMKYACDEAKRLKGEDEKEIEKDISYHVEIKDGLKSLVGPNNAWCAAFANWCLMKAGYPIQNPKETGFVDYHAAIARADGFIHLHGKRTEKKQKYDDIPFVPNPLYIKIDKPAYGALAVVTNANDHGHHVGLVYAKHGDDKVVLLGGNQKSKIKFSNYLIYSSKKEKIKLPNGKIKVTPNNPNHLLFFLPSSYADFFEKNKSKHEPLEGTADALNKAFGIVDNPNEAETER